MTDLADGHKEVLRTLVKLRRDGRLSEEFTVFQSGTKGQLIYSAKGRLATTGSTGRNRIVDAEGLTPLALESLTRSSYLFSITHYRHKKSSDEGPEGESDEYEYDYESSRDCYITPDGFRNDSDFAPVDDILMRRPPVEITSSLATFRADWPDPSRLAFVMMQFGSSKAHEQVSTAIRHALDTHQFIALRADSKQYHDDLWMNILTYMYGCRFGIAVFERIEADAINPNVSLEVGHMMGLGKPVCYLKERTLPALHSDLVGRLYRSFDLQSCEETIPPAVWKWMSDKGLMVQRAERDADEATP